MDRQDMARPYGRIRAKASTARRMPSLRAPPLNYTGGATVFAAFHNPGAAANGDAAYELFAAVVSVPHRCVSPRTPLSPHGVAAVTTKQ